MNARTLGPVFGFGLALATAAAYADRPVDHPTILVTVVQGQIQVSDPRADILRTEGAVVWKLPAGSGYEFPEKAIVVASPSRSAVKRYPRPGIVPMTCGPSSLRSELICT